LSYFQNSFTGAFHEQLAILWLLNIPSHFNRLSLHYHVKQVPKISKITVT